MSRYSVPFVLVLALPVAAGAGALLRRPPLGLVAMLAGAALFGRQAWPEVRYGATRETPPSAAIDRLARYGHPGRETIVADGVFASFLRTELWEGRLRVWGLTDDLLLGPVRSMNKRLVRLSDFSDEPDPPTGRTRRWQVWYHGGRVAEALGNRRLLAVGLRDPAPPLFGPGFGLREREPGQPSVRWAGPGGAPHHPGPRRALRSALLRGQRQARKGRRR